MSRPTGLDPAFVDGNVALGVLLGAMSACATVRALLPNPDEPASVKSPNATEATPVGASEAIDPFLALLLGTVALGERLTAISDSELDDIDRAVHEEVPAASLGRLLR